MNVTEQARRAQDFRRMHDRSRLLVLPNAWDPASARLFARAGFEALATTSAGIAWSAGYGDHSLPREDLLAATARIAAAVTVPVSADIESGYGRTPEEVGATVSAVIRAGAIGINLEDGLVDPARLRPLGEAVERLRAARAAADSAGVPLVINARVDAYLPRWDAGPEVRFEETLRRARAYLAAGADCVYPIGLGDAETIGALVRALDAPVNITARPGTPDAATLTRLGVARVSMAAYPAALALGAAERAIREVRRTGSFEALASPLAFPEIEKLFS